MSELVRLREPKSKEHKLLVEWRNEAAQFFFSNEPITLKSHKEWYKGVEDDPTQSFFMVEAVKAADPVGTIGLTDVGNGKGEYGRFLIAPEYRGSGFGRAAMGALLDYAFNELELTYVYGDIYAWNAQAISLDESLGFQREWIAYRDRDDCDKVRMSITREVWQRGKE